MNAIASILPVNLQDIKEEKPPKIDKEKTIPLSILDLSAGGMKITSPLDLPVKSKIKFLIQFEIESEKFEVYCELLRKEQIGNEKEYGVKFLQLAIKEEIRLVRNLNMLKIKQSKFIDNQNLIFKETIDIEKIVEVIEIMPGIAFILNPHRVVIAANKIALNKKMIIGDRCYIALNKNKKICTDCQIDKAQDLERMLTLKSTIFDQPCLKHWLHLGKGITLHYLQV